MSVLNYDAINADNVVINMNEIQKTTHMHSIPIRYNNNGNKQALLIQTPKMFAPFGASCFQKTELLASGKFPKYDICLSLNISDDRILQLSNFLSHLDSKICNLLAQNPQILDLMNVKRQTKKTGKIKTIDQIQEDIENNKYTPMIREGSAKPNSPNEFFPSLFKVKMDRERKNHRIVTFCQYGKEFVELTDKNIETYFKKGSFCKSVVHLSHIWIVNGRCGVSAKLMRCRLYPEEKPTYNFIPTESDDDDTNGSQANRLNEANGDNNQANRLNEAQNTNLSTYRLNEANTDNNNQIPWNNDNNQAQNTQNEEKKMANKFFEIQQKQLQIEQFDNDYDEYGHD